MLGHVVQGFDALSVPMFCYQPVDSAVFLDFLERGMIRKTTHVGARFSRYALVVAMSAALAACGGSSGDSTGVDLDMDGIDDSVDDFIDLDNNGINDADEIDLGGDFVDADMDGIDDSVDDFIDLNGNGINDADEMAMMPGNVGTNAELNCSGEMGTDAISGDDEWGNNCVVRRFATHSTSYYTRGIQRIINCTGVSVGTDAQFGPGSELAVETYQTNEGLTLNGQVDMATWSALRGELTMTAQDTTLGIETWAVVGDGSCAGQSQFFRNSDPVTGDILNWRIANNPGSGVDDQVEFSVRNPFN